ncbi:hypothetical protein CHS0354_004815 [Potamilus streckersoni]|uniref:Secreted protein n=1 Tax=Potamilus streckersoni TaxID=2493646 RepID=A0AAE0S8Y8_9BIVA|nr:hypothetical protein CHS0354_004815 [Potamilus streckersoni]
MQAATVMCALWMAIGIPGPHGQRALLLVATVQRCEPGTAPIRTVSHVAIPAMAFTQKQHRATQLRVQVLYMLVTLPN